MSSGAFITGELDRPERRVHRPLYKVSKYKLRLRRIKARDAKAQDALSLKAAFVRAKKIERIYAVRLRSVAAAVDHLVKGFNITTWSGIMQLHEALRRYADTLDPWARAVAEKMVAEAAARDERAWFKISAQMGEELKNVIENTPVGHVVTRRLDDQVKLITSLPREAAERVRKLATEARTTGARADETAKKIMETGNVTKARATMIARTETARTATELTHARARSVGSTHFIWRTAGDSDVRPSHRKLNGTTHRWDDPPLCDAPDHHALPGCIWNCRCYAEPVLDLRGNY